MAPKGAPHGSPRATDSTRKAAKKLDKKFGDQSAPTKALPTKAQAGAKASPKASKPRHKHVKKGTPSVQDAEASHNQSQKRPHKSQSPHSSKIASNAPPQSGNDMSNNAEPPASPRSSPSAKRSRSETVQDTASRDAVAESSPKLSSTERADARKRLLARLSLLANQRRGPSEDKPIRSRSELIAHRQEKEERRRARKKAERDRAKDSAKGSAEAEATRLVGGFGLAGEVGPGSHAAATADDPMDFTYSRLTTDDAPKTKKKRDLKGQLAVAEARDRRLAGFDASKRAEIESKDAWGAAAARINGEKTKSNSRLLRASAKRVEKRKKKSAREWQERVEGVEKGLKARQEKRTRALQQRRPGFEGSKRSHIAKG